MAQARPRARLRLL